MSRVNINNAVNKFGSELDLLEQTILNGRYQFNRDEEGNIVYDRNGNIDITKVKYDSKNPDELRSALHLYALAEKAAVKNGNSSSMSINRETDPDYEHAVALAGLLSSKALTQIARLGKHGAAAGNREQMIDFAGDYLWKMSYGYDPVTGVPLVKGGIDAGHTVANSRGGLEVRPEDSWINQVLQNTEGQDRLNAISAAQRKLNAYESSLNQDVLNDPDIIDMLPAGFLSDLQDKARKRGFIDASIIASAADGSTQNII